MIELKHGETYEIKTLEDLFNTPLNMQVDAMKMIVGIFQKRHSEIIKHGRDVEISNIETSLTNDGIDKGTMVVNGKEEIRDI